MYLKKLEMLGFKSFADKTELLFQPGMTGVVGPNGCGKSNVVDAFKWIFGEQSAKGMRGTEMKDVIFNGTQERKPTGFAEVTIVFENSDRFLDIDYAEVAITRRLFRSGESEYLINKQKARLKDIRELFMGTGVGQTSYSILEQGKIDVLLQSSNQDRRYIFEEAAGISKYLAKKEEALRALLRVEENLTRLNDIIDEVQRRLQRVKAQASKARRYRELSERLKELRVRSTLDDYRESRSSRAEISFQMYWCDLRLGSLDRLIERVSQCCESRAAERESRLSVLRGLREEIAQIQVRMERARERIEHGQRRLVELKDEEERKTNDLESCVATLRQLLERLEGERQELAAKVGEIAEKRDECDRLSGALQDVRSARERVEQESRDKKQAVVALLHERSRVGNSIVALESEASSLRGQKERLSAQIEGFQRQLEAVRERGAVARQDLERLGAERERMTALGVGLEAEASKLEEQVSVLDSAVADTVGRLNQFRSRHDVLRSLEENLEGVNRGVADVLRKKGSTEALADVHGMVASLVKVESRYARAVEAALGVHAQSLLVETQDGALGLLDFARAEKVGGIEVISLDRVDCVAAEDFPCQAGVLGSLRDKVEVLPEFSELFDRLLGNVVLVEDFSTALALSRNGLRPFRLVTLSGEALEPWGGLSISGETELGLISRHSEMEELGGTIGVLAQAERDLKERQAALRMELNARREERSRLREETSRLDADTAQAKERMEQWVREEDRISREVTLGARDLSDLESQISSRIAEKAELEVRAASMDSGRQAVEEEVRTLDERLESLKGEEGAAGEALTQVRLDLAQAEQTEQGLREMISRQEANVADREAQIENSRAEIAGLVHRREEIRQTIQASEAELSEAGGQQRTASASLEAEEGIDRSLQEREQEYRKALESLHQERASVQEQRQGAELKDQEERHRRNTLLERMDEDYGLDLARLVEMEDVVLEKVRAGLLVLAEGGGPEGGEAGQPAAAPEAPQDDSLPPEWRCLVPDPAWSRDRAREEIREIQEKIRRMGAVNLEALDELGELEERNRFQLAQRTDLVESEKSLRGIIGEINRTSRELFQKTFDEVQAHFGDLFRKCFGGGKAELVLEEGADVLEAGIDIVARPPGKKITRLSLMSGGEKTMTTIALLFAIFRARPSPFCILDEVDAPLDEMNVRRFVVLLKDFVSQTQFVVITHNKLTMAEANTLYGITMEERGVSKRVSVELANYDLERMESSVAR